MLTTERLSELAKEAKNKDLIYPNPNYPPSRYYRFLMLLAEEMNPELSVEVGVCGGGGSLHLARGWAAGHVLGIDYSWDHPENIIHIKENFPNFEFLLCNSLRATEYIKDIHGFIDILFIDSVHTYEHTMKEFEAYLPIMNEGGVVCLDDLFRPGMEEAWNDMPEPKIRLDDLHPGSKVDEKNGDGGFGAIIV